MILIIQLATNVSGICLHQLLFRGLHHNAVLATTKNLAFFGLGLLNLRACPKNQTFVLFRLIQRPCSHNLGNICVKETVNKYPGSKNSKYLVKWLRSVLKTEHRASRLALVGFEKIWNQTYKICNQLTCCHCHCNCKGCKWGWQKHINSQSCTFSVLHHMYHLSLALGIRV